MSLTNTTSPITTSRPKRRRRLVVALAAMVAVASFVGMGGTAGAATGTTGAHTRSAATCKPLSSPVIAGQSQIYVAAPKIYAANTTTRLDGQTVRFRQRLIKWNGSSWVNTGQQSAVWSGFATDSTAALDFSDGTRTVRMPAFNFAAGPGYYAVVTDYWWASTSYTSGGSDMLNAVHSPSSVTAYCGFAY